MKVGSRRETRLRMLVLGIEQLCCSHFLLGGCPHSFSFLLPSFLHLSSQLSFPSLPYVNGPTPGLDLINRPACAPASLYPCIRQNCSYCALPTSHFPDLSEMLVGTSQSQSMSLPTTAKVPPSFQGQIRLGHPRSLGKLLEASEEGCPCC